MRFKALVLALVAIGVLVATSVVGATSSRTFGGHVATSASAPAAVANPLDPLNADEIQRTFTTIENANLAPATFLGHGAALRWPERNGELGQPG